MSAHVLLAGALYGAPEQQTAGAPLLRIGEASLTIPFRSSLREIARALGGEVAGSQVLCPGPGHSPRDRSLGVKLSVASPDGFVAFSHAGDDWQACRDHVRKRLGMPADGWKRAAPAPRVVHKAEPPREDDDRTQAALKVWREGVDPRGTLAERYLVGRGLDLGDDVAREVLRWHPGIGAMIALFRDITTDELRAVSRTFLNSDGRKLERKFLGPVGGAAIKLDPDENVLEGLHIGEGVETCMAARQLGLRPAWALGSCGAIASFQVLSGIEALSILREHDAANKRAGDVCAKRWRDAGREVFDVWPNHGNDVADAIRDGD